MLKAHSGLAGMTQRTLEEDPFEPQITNPFKTHAIESNMWEVSVLKSHYNAQLRALCDFFSRPTALIPSIHPSDSLQTPDTTKRPRLSPSPWQSVLD